MHELNIVKGMIIQCVFTFIVGGYLIEHASLLYTVFFRIVIGTSLFMRCLVHTPFTQ